MSTKFIFSFVLFAIVMVSGIWMSKLGKPYQQALFTIHKLISIAAISIVAIAIFKLNKELGLNNQQLFLIIIVGILFVITLISGGILSAKEETAKIILISHKVLPVLFIIGLTTLFFLLKKGIN